MLLETRLPGSPNTPVTGQFLLHIRLDGKAAVIKGVPRTTKRANMAELMGMCVKAAQLFQELRDAEPEDPTSEEVVIQVDPSKFTQQPAVEQ